MQPRWTLWHRERNKPDEKQSRQVRLFQNKNPLQCFSEKFSFLELSRYLSKSRLLPCAIILPKNQQSFTRPIEKKYNSQLNAYEHSIQNPKDLRKGTIITVIKRVTKFQCWAFVWAFQFLLNKMTNIGSWEVSNCNFFIYCCSWLKWVKKTCYFVLFLSL